MPTTEVAVVIEETPGLEPAVEQLDVRLRVYPDACARRVRERLVQKGGVEMTTTLDAPIRTELPLDVPKFEYMMVPLQHAKGMKKDAPWIPDELNEYGADGWEAVGLTLKAGDLVAWPVVLLKRPV